MATFSKVFRAGRILPAVAALGLAAVIAVAAGAAPVAAQSSFSTSFKDLGSASNKQPIQIEADRAEVRDKENLVIFAGNVQVRQGESSLRAQRLKVYYEGKAMQSVAAQSGGGPAGNQQIRKLEAEGKVLIANKDQNATGDTGVFDMQAQVAVLTGNVVLNQGQNVGRGNKLTVDLKTGQARLEGGRVQFLLVPGQAGPAGGGATKPN